MDEKKDLEIQVAGQIKVAEPSQKKKALIFKKLTKTIGILIPVVASLIGIITYLLQIGSKKLEVTAQILSNDELTLYAPEAELNARFTYAGEDVSHLWKTRVRFINSGNKTIIGMGNQKNIIGDGGLNFAFLDGVKILNIQEEDDSFDASIVKTDISKFQIQFVQWRPNEYISICFYAASEKELKKNPLPVSVGREIIDGDLRTEDLTIRRGIRKKRMIDYLPGSVSLFGRILGLAMLAVIGFIAFFGTYKEWSQYFSIKKWFNEYSDKFADYLNNMKPPPSEENKKIFMKEPWRLPPRYWKDFEGGKECPSPDIIKNAKTGIVFTAIMTLIALGVLSIISTFIII